MMKLPCQRLWLSLSIFLMVTLLLLDMGSLLPLSPGPTVLTLSVPRSIMVDTHSRVVGVPVTQSFMSCHKCSRKEGHWVSGGHMQSWTSLHKDESQMMFCLLPGSYFFLPGGEGTLFYLYKSNPELSYGQRLRSFPGKLGPQANPRCTGLLWSQIICDSHETVGLVHMRDI